jgi:hypothetical protein
MKKQIPPRTAMAPTPIATAPPPLRPPDDVLPGVEITTGGVVAVCAGAGETGIPGANGLVALAAAAAEGAASIRASADTHATRDTATYRSDASGCSIAGGDGGLR